MDKEDDLVDVDLVEVPDGSGGTIWQVSDKTQTPDRVQVSSGRIGADVDHPGSQLPSERFANVQSASELAEMIQQIREAESGAPRAEIVVDPRGRIDPGGGSEKGDHPGSHLPNERFASAAKADRAEISRIDPRNACRWSWHEHASGWSFTLTPSVFNTEAAYTFLARRNPAIDNEWFGYCLAPNLDDFVGHEHHLQRINGLTVVCTRPGFRGHSTLRELHGALAKWAIYIEFISRGLPAPFSA